MTRAGFEIPQHCIIALSDFVTGVETAALRLSRNVEMMHRVFGLAVVPRRETFTVTSDHRDWQLLRHESTHAQSW